MKREKTKGTLSGVITVEMAYLMPMLFLVFLFTIYGVFYYHDKVILFGAASETAILGTQVERKPDVSGQTELEEFFQDRIRGKLILFPSAQVSVTVSSNQVEVSVNATKGSMKIKTEQKASIVVPEQKIRRKKIIEKLVKEEE